MNEDIEIINQSTRIEKIKNFFNQNLKKILVFLSIILIFIITYFALLEFKKNKKIKIAEKYNELVSQYQNNKENNLKDNFIQIIFENDSTYSPLALYFLIDNQLVQNKDELNSLFDQVINKSKLDYEIKNLIIYKKALINSDTASESDLINILKPVINSDSIWKSHSLYLLAEYFYSKNQKEKSKEFFSEIVVLDNANPDIKLEAQRKLNRDFSE
tara:strand:- start:1045 stop:1689 length:645 start_codon:yes stop_codon:yes gene_type:complete